MALNIDGTTGISGVDGSASAPALTGTDSNTGINFASDTVNINTGGSTKASISSVGKLTLTSTETSNSNPVVLNASGQAYYQVITPNNTIGGIKFGDTDDDDVGAIKYGHGDNSMRFDVNGSEKMRINSGAYVSFGTTSTNPTSGGSVLEGEFGHLQLSRTGTNGEVMIRFNRGGSTRGNITVSTSTTYNTSSDYRLKENISNLTDGITRLKNIIPRRFNFIDDENKKLIDGFIAHEVSSAVPEAIQGDKDAVELADNEEKGIKKGDPIYQQVDYSKFIPLLTAALQEAVAKIEVLETKVAALEAG